MGPYKYHKRYDSVGTFSFDWNAELPSFVQEVFVEIRGPGASGSGSDKNQYGGAGAGGAFIASRIARPSSNISPVEVGAGGVSIAANTQSDGNPGGSSSFGSVSAYGAGGGLAPPAEGTPGDGGTPGIAASGGYDYFWVPGGMGDASCPALGGINYSCPRGGNGALGGEGGHNHQGGTFPGGGGAPGNKNFPSGEGARGQVDVYATW